MIDSMLADSALRQYFETLPLATLRILGRRYGVPQASACHKQELINGTIDILVGRKVAPARSNRGAPAKTNYLDPSVEEEIGRAMKRAEIKFAPPMEVSSPEPTKTASLFEASTSKGVLELMQGGYGFLRAKNCQPSAEGDVFIAAPLIHALKLREGDVVCCTTKPRIKNESPAMDTLLSVNAKPVGFYEKRAAFESFTAKYATERLDLSGADGDPSLRLIDLFAPIGKGQRGLIIAPPKAGKTTLLKTIARSLSARDDLRLIILLIDERPEEVTDIRESVPRAEVIYSTFDELAEHHIRAAQLTLARAKRLVELGQDVVILLDSLTKLTRAYNYTVESTGKTLTGGLDVGAFAEPKRFFGAARNTVEAGSLTVLATALVETGSRMDDIIYEEFKGTGNSDIFLSRELAEKRIFPAIDIRRSGTRKEELLLKKEELEAVYKLRERGLAESTAGVLEMLKRTKNNADFVARLPEWLRVYKPS